MHSARKHTRTALLRLNPRKGHSPNLHEQINSKGEGKARGGEKSHRGEKARWQYFFLAAARGGDGGQEVIFHGRRSRTNSLYADAWRCLGLLLSI